MITEQGKCGVTFYFEVTDNGRRLKMTMCRRGEREYHTTIEFSRETTAQLAVALNCKMLEKLLEKQQKKTI